MQVEMKGELLAADGAVIGFPVNWLQK